MENFDQDELQHHGTKGMRWGVRRYQNKDGSLTPAGKKRYNKEMDKLKAEEQKLKAEQKVLSNKKKTQAKFDKLDEKKADLEAKRKALKDEEAAMKSGKKDKKPENPNETVEEKRARLLKSNDPNELYKNRDLLSTAEINERLERINTEKRLAEVAESTKTTGKQRIEKAIDTFKTVDNVYTTLSKSGLGGLVKKKLGIDDDKSGGFDLDKAYKNLYSMSDEQAKKAASRVENNEKIRKAWEQAHGKNNNQNQNKDKKDSDKKTDQTDDQQNNKKNNKSKDPEPERYEGTVEGEGASRKSDSSNTSGKKPDDYYDPIDGYGEWVRDTPSSGVSSSTRSAGESAVAGLIDTALNSEAARAGRLLLEEAIK